MKEKILFAGIVLLLAGIQILSYSFGSDVGTNIIIYKGIGIVFFAGGVVCIVKGVFQ